MKRLLNVIWPLLLALLLACAVSLKWSDLPPLAPFLNPIKGVWNRGMMALRPFDIQPIASHFKKKIHYQVDKNLVPHIFAEDEKEAYMAQGFYCASQRLWQMEFLSRLAAGRLSEIFGKRTIELDTHFRNLRLLEAAKASEDLISKDAFTSERIIAFTRGVNLFVDSLKPQDDPFEFKLFGIRPEKWSPLKSSLILKLMTYNLSGHSEDIKRTRSLLKLNSIELYKTLYPKDVFGPHYYEIEPSNLGALADPYTSVLEKNVAELLKFLPSPLNGSNSFATDASHNISGAPLLANDVHLDLTLPNLWYLIQIHTPQFNAMGVSLPGAPGVILGFNQDLSWGSTNSAIDSFDWFLVDVDSQSKSFNIDSQSIPLKKTTEILKVRNKMDQTISLFDSTLGPIYNFEEKHQIENNRTKSHRWSPLLMSWTGHKPSNEFKSFLQLMRAKSVSECREALVGFVAPLQNILCADRVRSEIILAGFIPQRTTFGDVVIPLKSIGQLWKKGSQPIKLSKIDSPDKRGLNLNANQSLAEGSAMGWGNEFAQSFRASRLEHLLKNQVHSFDTFRRIQNDVNSELAQQFLPFMVAYLSEQASAPQRDFIESLENWNFNFESHSPFAVFFKEWFSNLETQIWEKKLGRKDTAAWPKAVVLLRLLSDPSHSQFKDLQMDSKSISQAVDQSFAESFNTLHELFGKKPWREWRLSESQQTEFTHISRVPGLGRKVSAGGSYYSPFANYGKHGPTWKLIVSMKDPIKAWGLVPGGNSGDPLSLRYAENLEAWAKGEILPLNFMRKPTFLKEDLLVDFSRNEFGRTDSDRNNSSRNNFNNGDSL